MILTFLDQIKNIRFEQKINYGIIIALLLIVIIQSIVIANISNANNRSYRISIPPNLDFGATIKTGEVNKFEVHQFAGSIEQQLNFWDKNGAVDFKENIDKLSIFLTPRYKEYLLHKYTNLLNVGELTNREKSLQPLQRFNEFNVTENEKTAGWLVSIDFKSQEHINNKRFKNKKLRYFISVVLRDINQDLNPWGLQLDIPSSEPLELN